MQTSPASSDIFTLVSQGIVLKGKNIGSPGKEIYQSLRTLSKDDIIKLAYCVSLKFPLVPPDDHVAQASFIRYIYGMNTKQGILLSKQSQERIKNIDWTSSDEFMLFVNKNFEQQGNTYGQVLYYEMSGHRYCDLAFLEKDKNLLEEGLKNYQKSHELAIKCGSFKHVFSPIYWGSEYLNKMNDDRSVKWAVKTIELMESYCKKSRDGYKNKAFSAMYIVYDRNPKMWRRLYKFLKQCKNKVIRQALSKFHKYVLDVQDPVANIFREIREIINSTKEEKEAIGAIRNVLLFAPRASVFGEINNIALHQNNAIKEIANIIGER